MCVELDDVKCWSHRHWWWWFAKGLAAKMLWCLYFLWLFCPELLFAAWYCVYFVYWCLNVNYCSFATRRPAGWLLLIVAVILYFCFVSVFASIFAKCHCSSGVEAETLVRRLSHSTQSQGWYHHPNLVIPCEQNSKRTGVINCIVTGLLSTGAQPRRIYGVQPPSLCLDVWGYQWWWQLFGVTQLLSLEFFIYLRAV